MDPLLKLKDIHQPAAISWWPLAPGWYVVLGLVLGMIGYLIFLIYRRQQRHQVAKLALQRLHQLRQAAATTPNHTIVIELSILLRRVALIQHARQTVAGLQGDAWLAFLDNTANTTNFSEGAGRVLASAPYQKTAQVDYDALFALVEKWIKGNSKGV